MTGLTINSVSASHSATKINEQPHTYLARLGLGRYLIILGAILFALQNSLVAATYYVAKTGNDNNAGTSTAPWLTVQKAANVVAAGDTVNVAAGTYAEKATVSRGGTSSSKISFVANGSVTIGGFYVTSPYISLTGFNCNGTGVDANDAAITYYYNAHYGEVRNCSISGVLGIVQGAGGLYFYSNNCLADGIVMTNPNFHALILIGTNILVKNFAITMSTGWDVVRVVGSNATIQDGTISASNPGELNTNHCDLFQTFGDDPATVCKDVVIERVYVSNGQGYQLGNITDDQENENISRWTFRNNTFVDVERVVNHYAPNCNYLNNTFVRCGTGSGWVISIGSSGAGRSNNLTVKNNIFYQCGYPTNAYNGWYAGDPVTGTVADYNLVVGTGAGTTKDSTSWRNGIGGISGNFEANGLNGVDPLFVNPSAGNYSLQSGSPALARGMGANAVPPNGTPAFTSQPTSQSVAVGANVTFTAAASGTPTPTYQWRKEGVNISGATSATLTLSSVATSAAGTYTVMATNSVGSATSNGAVLTVSSGTTAPAFTSQPAGQSVSVGANVTFTAAASGTPTPTYQWRKGGVNISGATSATLTLASVATSAAGTYSLVATNSVGSATSNGAILTVGTGTGGAPCWVMGHGDSILAGYAASDSATKNPIALMQAAYPAVTFVNSSAHGAQIATNASGSVALAALATATSTGYSKYTIVLEFGLNDLATNDSASNIEANITTWITNVRAAYPSVKIVGCTPHFINFGANQAIFEPRRQALNTWIRSWTVANGHANGFDTVCDIAADSRLGTDFTNTTYYYNDQVHLTDVGYSVWSGLMQATLSANGFFTPPPLAPSNAKTSITIN